MVRRLTAGRFAAPYPAQREAVWALCFGARPVGSRPVVAQLPTGKGKGGIALLWAAVTGGTVLECVPLTSIGLGQMNE